MAKETRPTKRGRPKSASPVIFKPVYLAVENFTAWRSLRSELGFYSDNELAKELLSTYNEVTSQRRRRNAVKCVQVDETHDATISLCSPCTEKSPVQNSSFNDEYSSSSVGGRQEEEAEIIPLQQSRSSTVRDVHLTPPSPPRNTFQVSKRKRTCKIDSFLERIESNLRQIKDDINTSPCTVTLNDSDIRIKTNVKVRSHGIIEKWKIEQNEPFSNICTSIAAKEAVSSSRIQLMIKDKNISPSDTVQSLGLTVTDIIDCIVLPVYGREQFVYDNSDVITLKVQMQDEKGRCAVRIGKSAPLAPALSSCLSAKQIDIKRIRAYFDGESIALDKTPNQLGMEDDDVIDIVLSI